MDVDIIEKIDKTIQQAREVIERNDSDLENSEVVEDAKELINLCQKVMSKLENGDHLDEKESKFLDQLKQ